QVADLAAAHADGDVAIGGGKHRGHRIARADQVEAAGKPAGGVAGEFDVREQLREFDLADVGPDPGGDRVGARVHAHLRADVAAGDAEVQRFQARQPAVQEQVRVHVVNRHVGRVDA